MKTFCITVCTKLVKFLPMVSEIYEAKDPLLFIVKVFNCFRYVPQVTRYFLDVIKVLIQTAL